MLITDFSFIVTGECNFNCSYCYQAQAKRNKKWKNKLSLHDKTIKKTIDFFVPSFADRCYVSFYGGEPLLAFKKIKYAIQLIQEKKTGKDIRYVMTTNGSMIDDRMIAFLEQHHFSLLLSYDGLAQDISRQSDSATKILSTIKKILPHQGIDLEINSVFTPGTVQHLSNSVEAALDNGIPSIQISIASGSDWDATARRQLEEELIHVKNILIPFYKDNGYIPVANFRSNTSTGKDNNKKSIFACFAGKTRMAISPDAKLWGCFLFWDYATAREAAGKKDYENYCFGDLDTFINQFQTIYPRVLAHYSKLRMDHFCTNDGETFCMFCDRLEECRVCPVNAALAGAVMGTLPTHLCEINRLIAKIKNMFWQEIPGSSTPSQAY